MERLLEGFARSFFPGERRDWVPVSSRNGPFVAVFEEIIKDAYKLCRNERSLMLRQMYRNDGLHGQQTEMVRISVEDPSLLDAPSSHVRVFRYRRLPSLTRHVTEVRPLVQWLKDV